MPSSSPDPEVIRTLAAILMADVAQNITALPL